MRILALVVVILAGCATPSGDAAKNAPQATFSSTKPVPVVLACVQRRLDMFEWGHCPHGGTTIRPNDDHSALAVEGQCGGYATLEGQQKGDQSVYELRVARRADWGLCSMSGVFRELARLCM